MKQYLYNVVNLSDTLYEHREVLPPDAKAHLYQAILSMLEAWVKEFTEEYGPECVSETTKPVKITETAKKAPEPETKPEPEPEQSKRRGRKKKEEVQQEQQEPEEAPPSLRREAVFGRGLDKDLVSLSNIDGITDDVIVNENLGPIPLANSIAKQGEHPFFKGPAQFVWYLPPERWALYLADLFEEKDAYPNQLSLYDSKRLEEAKKAGVDIEFVTALVNKESKQMVSIEDFKESEYGDDDKGMEELVELKESGFLRKFVAEIDPDKTLLKFLTRFGQNRHIAEDLQTIYEEHTEHPNKYIAW